MGTQIPKRGRLTSYTPQTCSDKTLGSSGNGQLVDQMSPCCDPPGLAMFIYNEMNTRHAVPDNTWFESMHITLGGDGTATWYYLVFGSAIWVNTGKTKVFTDHFDCGCGENGHSSWSAAEKGHS